MFIGYNIGQNVGSREVVASACVQVCSEHFELVSFQRNEIILLSRRKHKTRSDANKSSLVSDETRDTHKKRDMMQAYQEELKVQVRVASLSLLSHTPAHNKLLQSVKTFRDKKLALYFETT